MVEALRCVHGEVWHADEVLTALRLAGETVP
jgi:hypothetical protein